MERVLKRPGGGGGFIGRSLSLSLSLSGRKRVLIRVGKCLGRSIWSFRLVAGAALSGDGADPFVGVSATLTRTEFGERRVCWYSDPNSSISATTLSAIERMAILTSRSNGVDYKSIFTTLFL